LRVAVLWVFGLDVLLWLFARATFYVCSAFIDSSVLFASTPLFPPIAKTPLRWCSLFRFLFRCLLTLAGNAFFTFEVDLCCCAGFSLLFFLKARFGPDPVFFLHFFFSAVLLLLYGGLLCFFWCQLFVSVPGPSLFSLHLLCGLVAP